MVLTDQSRTKSKNGRDFAITGVILAIVLVYVADLYCSDKYEGMPEVLIPWYAANPWVNLVVGVLAGAIIGGFIGISIPVSERPDERQPGGKDLTLCLACNWQNKQGDRFCEQCGAELV